VIVATILAVSLVILTFLFHHVGLLWLAGGMAHIAMTGAEALSGLLLIAWSGSFIYIAPGRLWPWQTCVEPVRATDATK